MRLQTANRRLLGWALALICSCGGNTTEVQTFGGETHFLQHCVNTCEGELACVNGVCSRTCDAEGDGSECAGLASAAVLRCILPMVSSGESAPGDVQPETVANCDAGCTNDRDCSDLGSEHLCESGFCRKAARSSSDSNAMASMMLDEVDVCPLLDDESGSLGVQITVRNLTGAPIYWEPNSNCAGEPSPVTISDEAGRELLVYQPVCTQTCEDLLANGPPTTPCRDDCRVVYPYKQSGGVYLVATTATLFVPRDVPAYCIDSEESSSCFQSVNWPEGEITLSARAYRAADCIDPELCDCYMPDDNSPHEAEEIPCDLSLLEQAGWFEATTTTTYAEIVRTGLAEVVFEAGLEAEIP